MQSGPIKLTAKVYKDGCLMRPLVAADDITSQGNDVILHKHGLTVKDQTGKTLMYSPKDPNCRLWPMPSLTTTSSNEAKQTLTTDDSHDRCINNIVQQSRQNVRSTQIKCKTTDKPYNSNVVGVSPLRAYAKVWDTSSSDLPGPLPVTSLKGYRYIRITTYRNYIHAEPMKSRSQQDFKRAYSNTFKFYKSLGHSPKYHRMDNETSTLVENYLENEMDTTVQYVPPGNHRKLPAERSIQSYKNHFISSISHMHPECPLQLWADFMRRNIVQSASQGEAGR